MYIIKMNKIKINMIQNIKIKFYKFNLIVNQKTKIKIVIKVVKIM
jgi:hypothetical protein